MATSLRPAPLVLPVRSNLDIRCGRCGQLAAVLSFPPDREMPKVPADAKFVVRNAVKLLARGVPKFRDLMLAAVEGKYSEAMAGVNAVAQDANVGDMILCGDCVRSSQS